MEVCRWEAHHPNATGSERFQRATGDEVNFSATAQRTSQKILASEAACHKDWSFVAVDIGKAFLHLLTFSDMNKLTGEPEKHLSFNVPTGTAKHLRRIPGYEDFCERKEAQARNCMP